MEHCRKLPEALDEKFDENFKLPAVSRSFQEVSGSFRKLSGSFHEKFDENFKLPEVSRSFQEKDRLVRLMK